MEGRQKTDIRVQYKDVMQSLCNWPWPPGSEARYLICRASSVMTTGAKLCHEPGCLLILRLGSNDRWDSC